MTNYLRVDAVNRQLVMDKTFAKNAQIVGSAEYDMLQRARSDYATYSVVTRQIKRNLNKESYLASCSIHKSRASAASLNRLLWYVPPLLQSCMPFS